jgi:hypothetical protein
MFEKVRRRGTRKELSLDEDTVNNLVENSLRKKVNQGLYLLD